MKRFIEILYRCGVPIWVDVVDRAAPPELNTLNEELEMFADKLLVKEIANRRDFVRLRGRGFSLV